MLFRAVTRSFRVAFPAFFLSAIALGACSATDGEGSKAPKGQGGNGAAGGGPGGFNDDDFDGGGNLDENSACASVKRTGELVPLDMYVMLDKSASMVNEGDGKRWVSVVNALKSFVDSDDSRGMGMGLGYFPAPRSPSTPPAPANCTDSSQCMPYYGDCIFGFNVCEGNFMGSTDSCMGGDCKKPAVGIKLLPMVADDIKKSLNATKANGDSTPTLPALDGAHLYAREWAIKNPGHVTVVVLATDGEPTGCAASTVNHTDNIAARAEAAFKGHPSIPTFVIGVGNKLGDLHSIAAAGGTDSAVYLSDSQAYQGLLDALNEIRGSVACEYRIPTPPDGKEPDYDRVNVNITVEGETETIGRVAAASECHPDKGGWYYDNTKDPSKILLCHKSCELVKSGSQMAPVEVDVLLGCKSKLW